MCRLYYTPPKDHIFQEVKAKAIEVWKGYDNSYGYVDEKVNSIKGLPNVRDNFMHIVAMFDTRNQVMLAIKLTPEARLAIHDRLASGGAEEKYNMFFE